jgi:hypothetical protein
MSNGIVNIKGKDYKTVALRVQEFRANFPGHSLITDIVKIDDDQCIVKASIYKITDTGDGVVIATGHAQEFRKASQINGTSYVENCETSAIGRALAGLGIGGTEFASANEVVNAIHQQNNKEALDNLKTIYADKGIDAARVYYANLSKYEKDQCKEFVATLKAA